MEVENNVDKALPYGTTSANITKLLDAIKAKEGSEKTLRQYIVVRNLIQPKSRLNYWA